MKKFIVNLLNAFGLGVHGNIRSYKSLFPLYEFDIKELQSNSSTTIIEVVDTLDVVFTIQLEHDSKGYITKIDII